MEKSIHTPVEGWDFRATRTNGIIMYYNVKTMGAESVEDSEKFCHLIDSAPALLEALKTLVYVTGFQYKDTPAHKAAIEAIRKVGG